MQSITGNILKLGSAVFLWLITVIARFKIHAEPGEAIWFMWVGAQGICAASFGWQLALTHWNWKKK